ncbi:hypothetical protein [Aerococcus mictus]|nr:hypothetical protein [Aerococcus mictus]
MKYRRITSTANSKLQGYQITLIALVISVVFTLLLLLISYKVPEIAQYISKPLFISYIFNISLTLLLIYLWSRREQTSTLSIPIMSRQSEKLAKKLKGLFSDKQITDVLKLSNLTRYGHEMPEIYSWVNNDLSEGFIAIENIANWERADRQKFEQRVSGILAGKYQRFAVTRSELTAGDSFIIFYFEDTMTSQRLTIKNQESLKSLISKNKHAIRLSKDLVWYSDKTPMMSIIARTRSGKSVLAGNYMARMMLLQGWIVEYNSAKLDRYVKEFNGQSDPLKIVDRAE